MAVEYSDGFGNKTLGVRYVFTGDELAKALGDASERLSEDLSVPLTDVAHGMYADVLGFFGNMGMGTWPPVSDATTDDVRRGNKGSRIGMLREDDELYASIFYRVDPHEAAVYTSVATGILHERGRKQNFVIGHKKASVKNTQKALLAGKTQESLNAAGVKTFGISGMPARPFLWVTKEREEMAFTTILDYILEPVVEDKAA